MISNYDKLMCNCNACDVRNAHYFDSYFYSQLLQALIELILLKNKYIAVISR